MIVVALTGLAGAGKDSVADILVRDHGFVKMSFADPLKRMVQTLDPIVGYYDESCCIECGPPHFEPVYLTDLYDNYLFDDEDIKDSEYGDEVRRLWQRFGTDVMRAEDPNYWVNKAQRAILDSGYDKVVLSDCRFPNEADMIYALGSPGDEEPVGWADFPHHVTSVWQVIRPDLEAGDHISEQYAGSMAEEISIHNYGTLAELAEPVQIATEYVVSGTVKDLNARAWMRAFGGMR